MSRVSKISDNMGVTGQFWEKSDTLGLDASLLQNGDSCVSS